MRQAFAVIFLAIIWSLALCAGAQRDPYDLQLKKIYSQPAEDSKLVYEIPIEVKLLDISSDANWYKVKIAFDLGVLGKYSYQGWVQIPIGQDLADRLSSKIALKK